MGRILKKTVNEPTPLLHLMDEYNIFILNGLLLITKHCRNLNNYTVSSSMLKSPSTSCIK